MFNREVLLGSGVTCISSAVAESFTIPVDCVKTNMQVGNRGVRETVGSLYREGGVRRFYWGIQPAIMRHWVYTNLRVGVYRPLLDKISGGKDKDEVGVGMRFLAGASAGGLSQLVANPTDLLKVKMQTRVGGKSVGFSEAVSGIYKVEGLRGFYRGSVPNVQRAVMVNAGELAAYDTAKRFLMLKMGLGDNNLTFIGASIFSGFFSTVLSCPPDVIKSRMMSSGGEGGMKYKGVLDCYVRTIKNDGMMALYRGFFPIWFRLGPWQLIFWIVNENLRKAIGLETF